MYCQNCGAKLNDGAKFCHECGAPCSSNNTREIQAEQVEPIPLRIERTRSGGGIAVAVQVFIDGEHVGTVKYGDELNVFVLPGQHHIHTKMKGSGSGEDDFYIPEDAINAEYVFRITGLNCHSERVRFHTDGSRESINVSRTETRAAAPARTAGQKICPSCGGSMTIQTVTEAKKTGCGTILLYILLAVTVLGLLIVIPLALRNKTETVTYSVCQNCGYRTRIGRY